MKKLKIILLFGIFFGLFASSCQTTATPQITTLPPEKNVSSLPTKETKPLPEENTPLPARITLEKQAVNPEITVTYERGQYSNFELFKTGLPVVSSIQKGRGLILKNHETEILVPYHLVAGSAKITVQTPLTKEEAQLKITKRDECLDLAILSFVSPIATNYQSPLIFSTAMSDAYPRSFEISDKHYASAEEDFWQNNENPWQIYSAGKSFPALADEDFLAGTAVYDQENRLLGIINTSNKQRVSVTNFQTIEQFLREKEPFELGANSSAFVDYGSENARIQGVLIHAVEPQSVAASLGFQAGDIITEIDQQSVAYSNEKSQYCKLLSQAAANYQAKQSPLLVTILRPDLENKKMTVLQGTYGSQPLAKKSDYDLEPQNIENPGSRTPCRKWEEITLADYGKEVCVYGKVGQIVSEVTTAGRALKLFPEGSPKKKLILVYYSKYGILSNFLGGCINVTGEVRQLGKNPALSFSDGSPIGRCLNLYPE